MNQAADDAVRSHQVAWNDPRAVALREAMDEEIQVRYAGRDTDPDLVRAALTVDPADVVATVILLAADGPPVGHAALRRLREEFEVKRVIVDSAYRGRGLAVRLMAELEEIGRTAGARRLILQTGDRQPEAVALYLRLGYLQIPNYEPYATAIPFSLCFAKELDEPLMQQ